MPSLFSSTTQEHDQNKQRSSYSRRGYRESTIAVCVLELIRKLLWIYSILEEWSSD